MLHLLRGCHRKRHRWRGQLWAPDVLGVLLAVCPVCSGQCGRRGEARGSTLPHVRRGLWEFPHSRSDRTAPALPPCAELARTAHLPGRGATPGALCTRSPHPSRLQIRLRERAVCKNAVLGPGVFVGVWRDEHPVPLLQHGAVRALPHPLARSHELCRGGETWTGRASHRPVGIGQRADHSDVEALSQLRLQDIPLPRPRVSPHQAWWRMPKLRTSLLLQLLVHRNSVPQQLQPLLWQRRAAIPQDKAVSSRHTVRLSHLSRLPPWKAVSTMRRHLLCVPGHCATWRASSSRTGPTDRKVSCAVVVETRVSCVASS